MNSIVLEINDIDVTVEYIYHHGIIGRYCGPPELCYPSELTEVEVTNMSHSFNWNDLSKDDKDDIKQRIIEHEEDSIAEARAEAYIAAHEFDEQIF